MVIEILHGPNNFRKFIVVVPGHDLPVIHQLILNCFKHFS